MQLRLSILILACVSVAGCAGYHMGVRSLYAPDIETIFVPIFESNSFRPDLGERLTEAVIKEIEQKTPYKVVGNPDDADSVLSGRILSDEKRVLIENNNDAPRQLEAALVIEVRWVNRRGDLIRDPGAVPLPPPLLTMQETAALVPEAGQSIATSQQEAIDNLATRIVEMMEIPW
jgi:hypothetical protein